MSANHRPITTVSGPSRRTVVRTAAWTVPAVSVAATAPAYAASTCLSPKLYTLNWGSTGYSHPTSTPNYGVATVTSTNNPTIYVHFSTTFRGSGQGDGTINNVANGEARNLSVPSATAGTDTTRDPGISNLGGLGANETGLRLQQISPAGYANRQDITVTFRSGAATNSSVVQVQGLSFHIVDIDAITNSPYSDRVAFNSPVAFGQTKDAAILGAGTTAAESGGNAVGPWRNTNANTNQSENTTGARVRITYEDDYAYRLSSFGFSYWTNTGATAPATGQYHRIYLSDFSFRTCP